MNRPRSFRKRYLSFVEDYRRRRLDEAAESAAPESAGKPRREHRKYIREYLRWLWPHRFAVGALFALALAGAGLQMVEPLFMRYIVDRVLLIRGLDPETRRMRLNLAGTLFFSLIVVSNLIGALRDYRQRLLNTKVMLALRRALFERLLHLPLSKLWDMKTGGILSRLTGDVDTTTGLMQMAIVSPSVSLIRLIIAVGVLTGAQLAAGAGGPGHHTRGDADELHFRDAASGPFTGPSAKTWNRSTAAWARRSPGFASSGRSGVSCARCSITCAGGTPSCARSCSRSAARLVLWTSWGRAAGSRQRGHRLVWRIPAYLRGGASIGDIMAFQWYTFLLLNPVWNIVNSFSELQRSLAAMERVFEILAMERRQAGQAGRPRGAARGARAAL